jgi:hypothetical protein
MSVPEAPDHVVEKGKGADAHEKGANTAQLIERCERWVVFGNPPWHTIQAQPVVRGKAEIEANEGEKKMELAKGFIEHSPGEFWIPMVDRTKDDKH